MLSGHTDVVPVDEQVWASDPFKLDRRATPNGDRLYARGSADMKGFIACVMAHAAGFAAADLRTPIHFAFSYDEEVGCTGVQGLIADMKREPARPACGDRGRADQRCRSSARTRAGAAFTCGWMGWTGIPRIPDLGANAIFAAARIVSHVEDMQERFRRETDPSNGFDPYFTTVNVGTIEGGTAHNVIPALVRDDRLLPQHAGRRSAATSRTSCATSWRARSSRS